MLPDEQASPQQLAILRRMTGQRRLRLAEEPIWLAPPEYTIVRKLEYFREGGSESIYAMFVPCWPYRVNPSTELSCWIGLPGGGFKLSGKAFLDEFYHSVSRKSFRNLPQTCLPVLNPSIIGSTMRAAPSTQSSGGWN